MFQNWLKIPRDSEMLFRRYPVNYRVFLPENSPVFFPTHIAARSFKARPVTSIRLFALEFIQRHCHTRMLRINFGLTWPLDLVEREHGMADLDSRHIASTPPVWSGCRCVSLRKTNLLSGCKLHGANQTCDSTQDSRVPHRWSKGLFSGGFFKRVKAWLSRIRAADSGGGLPPRLAVATLMSQKRNLPLSSRPCGLWKRPNSCQ